MPAVGVIGEVLPIGNNVTTTVTSDDSSASTTVEKELVNDLEVDEQVTGEDFVVFLLSYLLKCGRRQISTVSGCHIFPR